MRLLTVACVLALGLRHVAPQIEDEAAIAAAKLQAELEEFERFEAEVAELEALEAKNAEEARVKKEQEEVAAAAAAQQAEIAREQAEQEAAAKAAKDAEEARVKKEQEEVAAAAAAQQAEIARVQAEQEATAAAAANVFDNLAGADFPSEGAADASTDAAAQMRAEAVKAKFAARKNAPAATAAASSGGATPATSTAGLSVKEKIAMAKAAAAASAAAGEDPSATTNAAPTTATGGAASPRAKETVQEKIARAKAAAAAGGSGGSGGGVGAAAAPPAVPGKLTVKEKIALAKAAAAAEATATSSILHEGDASAVPLAPAAEAMIGRMEAGNADAEAAASTPMTEEEADALLAASVLPPEAIAEAAAQVESARLAAERAQAATAEAMAAASAEAEAAALAEALAAGGSAGINADNGYADAQAAAAAAASAQAAADAEAQAELAAALQAAADYKEQLAQEAAAAEAAERAASEAQAQQEADTAARIAAEEEAERVAQEAAAKAWAQEEAEALAQAAAAAEAAEAAAQAAQVAAAESQAQAEATRLAKAVAKEKAEAAAEANKKAADAAAAAAASNPATKANDSAGGSSSNPESEKLAFKERLIAFYTFHGLAAKVASVDDVVTRFGGSSSSRAKAFTGLVAKYGPEPPEATASDNEIKTATTDADGATDDAPASTDTTAAAAADATPTAAPESIFDLYAAAISEAASTVAGTAESTAAKIKVQTSAAHEWAVNATVATATASWARAAEMPNQVASRAQDLAAAAQATAAAMPSQAQKWAASAQATAAAMPSHAQKWAASAQTTAAAMPSQAQKWAASAQATAAAMPSQAQKWAASAQATAVALPTLAQEWAIETQASAMAFPSRAQAWAMETQTTVLERLHTASEAASKAPAYAQALLGFNETSSSSSSGILAGEQVNLEADYEQRMAALEAQAADADQRFKAEAAALAEAEALREAELEADRDAAKAAAAAEVLAENARKAADEASWQRGEANRREREERIWAERAAIAQADLGAFREASALATMQAEVVGNASLAQAASERASAAEAARARIAEASAAAASERRAAYTREADAAAAAAQATSRARATAARAGREAAARAALELAAAQEGPSGSPQLRLPHEAQDDEIKAAAAAAAQASANQDAAAKAATAAAEAEKKAVAAEADAATKAAEAATAASAVTAEAAAAAAAASTAAADTVGSSKPGWGADAVGARVQLGGLVSAAHLNGLQGAVVKHNATSGLYSVKLDDPTQKLKLVREDNLHKVDADGEPIPDDSNNMEDEDAAAQEANRLRSEKRAELVAAQVAAESAAQKANEVAIAARADAVRLQAEASQSAAVAAVAVSSSGPADTVSVGAKSKDAITGTSSSVLNGRSSADWSAFVEASDGPSFDPKKSLVALPLVPLKRFQFTLDTVDHRYRLGALPADAEAALAPLYSEELVRTRLVPVGPSGGRNGNGKPQSVRVVEQAVVFMHALAATQLLDRMQGATKQVARHLSAKAADTYARAGAAMAATGLAIDGGILALGLPHASNKRATGHAVIQEWRTAAQRRLDRKATEAWTHHYETLATTKREVGTIVASRWNEKLAAAQARMSVKHAAETDQGAARDFALRRASEDEIEKLENATRAAELHRRRVELELLDAQAKVERARLQDVLSTELESAVAKTTEDAALARLNEDVKLRAIRAEGEEALERARDAIALAFWSLGKGATHLASQPQDLARVLASLVLLLGGWFTAREGSLLLRKLLAKRLSKPALVRETSRQSGLRGALAFVLAAFRGLWEQLRLSVTGTLPSVGLEEAVLNGIVFAPSLRESVGGLALSVARAHSRSAPLRHLLVYGPPGTGKTMVARRIAALSGLDYAVMSGGDLGPLGHSAVSEVHALLAWANASPRGLLLFVDEAEAALPDRRAASGVSEVAQNVLNTFLYHTGAQSSQFMLVLATNRPSDLDEALLDRMDEVIHVPLPGLAERQRLNELYYRDCLAPLDAKLVWKQSSVWQRVGLSAAAAGRVLKLCRPLPPRPVGPPPDLDVPRALADLALQTEGFSGREVHKLFLSLQGVVLSTDACLLTRKLWDDGVAWKVAEFKRKQQLQETGNRIRANVEAHPTASLAESVRSAAAAAAAEAATAEVASGNGGIALPPRLQIGTQNEEVNHSTLPQQPGSNNCRASSHPQPLVAPRVAAMDSTPPAAVEPTGKTKKGKKGSSGSNGDSSSYGGSSSSHFRNDGNGTNEDGGVDSGENKVSQSSSSVPALAHCDPGMIEGAGKELAAKLQVRQRKPGFK